MRFTIEAVIKLAFSATMIVNAFELDYYDCHSAKTIHRYPTSSACRSIEAENSTTENWDLLQKVDETETSGWSCEVRVSSFTVFCGVYGHNKLINIPTIELNEPVTAGECNVFANRRTFRDHDRRQHALTIPGETIISNYDKGIIKSSGDISCVGETMKIGDEVIERVLVLTQYRVTVRKEKFRLIGGRSGSVEVLTEHLKLPKTCRPKTGSCTLLRTYNWLPPLSRCNLEKIRTMRMQKHGPYLVDHHGKILLKKLSALPSPAGCPTTQMFQTEYPDLFLAPPGHHFSPFGNEVEVEAFARGLVDYSLWISEKNLKIAMQSAKLKLCNHKYDISDTKHHHVEGEIFASRRGDVMFLYQCKQITGRIMESTKCFADIPLITATPDTKLFVDPITKISKLNSPVTECNTRFPLEVQTKQGYVSITPKLTRVDTPESRAVEDEHWRHEDMSSAGTYLDPQFKSWRSHLEDGSYGDAILGTITFQAGVHEGVISDPGNSGWNLQSLTPDGMIADFEKDIWKKVDRFVTQYAGYLCLIVIGIEMTKFIITIAILGMTLVTEGVAGLRGLLVQLCCTKYSTYSSARGRARKRRSTRRTLNEQFELMDDLNRTKDRKTTNSIEETDVEQSN